MISDLIIKQKERSGFETLFYVDLPGFEPRQTEPKSVVLPLHHRSILDCKYRANFLDSKLF